MFLSSELPRLRLDPESRLDYALGLFKEQDNHDPSCSMTEHPWLPKRVLSLGSSTTDVHLLELDVRSRCQYVALSYCWGTESPQSSSTRETIASYRQNIPWDTLPSVFQDAIKVTQRLGLKFLWIDALCIQQDDRSDWEHHAAEMADIYGNATLTISAASSSDPSRSFLSQKSPLDTASIDIVHSDVASTKVTARKMPYGLHSANRHDPVDSRAWTYQETYLSRHTLLFTAHEIQWRCQTLLACECLTTAFNRPILSKPDQVTLPDWFRVVSEYSQRSFTYKSDRLPAITGIAKTFDKTFRQVAGSSTYVVGNWREHMIPCLHWNPKFPHNDYYTVCLPLSNPTFSWTAVDSGAWYSSAVYDDRFEYWAQMIDLKFRLATSNPFGPTEYCELTIDAPFKDCYVSARILQHPKVSYTLEIDYEGVYSSPRIGWRPDVNLQPYDGFTIENFQHSVCRAADPPAVGFDRLPVRLACLGSIEENVLTNVYVLVLGPSKDHDNAWERLGICQVNTGNVRDGKPPLFWKQWKSAERKELILV